MRESPSTVRTLDLPSGSLVPFVSVPGERVRVLYGRVWLTAEGDTRDAFLASGEDASLASRGLAVIEALGPARVELVQPVRVPSWIARAAAAVVRRARASLRRRMPRSPRAVTGAA
ncbi:MAG: DUF2917 domain-containing protein [Betaproteobacteria bacterium]